MADTLTQTYTQSPVDERLRQAQEAAQRNTGMVNPASVQQAIAEQTLSNDPALNQSIGQQETALSAMQQLADFDRQLASQQTQGNDQLRQNMIASQQSQRAMGAFDPNNPSATIAQGPASFDIAEILRSATPTSLISPFAASSIVSGQQGMNVDAFNMAQKSQEARQRNLGFEIAALAKAYQTQFELEQRKKELEDAQRQQDFDNALSIAKLTGSRTFTDPLTGKSYDIAGESSSGILSRVSASGKTFLEEVTDGFGNFSDVLRNNPGLSQEEVYELARVNAQKFGAFRENDEQLRAMGLSPELMDELGIPRATSTGDSSEIDGYIRLINEGKMKLENVPAEMRNKVVSALSSVAPEQFSGPSDESKKIISVIDQLLEEDTNPMTGTLQLRAFIPGTRVQKAVNLDDQLKGLLSLENREKLKGSGAISDFESRTLEKAASAIGRNLKDTDYRSELKKLKTELETGVPFSPEDKSSGYVIEEVQ